MCLIAQIGSDLCKLKAERQGLHAGNLIRLKRRKGETDKNHANNPLLPKISQETNLPTSQTADQSSSKRIQRITQTVEGIDHGQSNDNHSSNQLFNQATNQSNYQSFN